MNAAVRDMNAAVRRSYVDPCRGRGLLFQASACEGGRILYGGRPSHFEQGKYVINILQREGVLGGICTYAYTCHLRVVLTGYLITPPTHLCTVACTVDNNLITIFVNCLSLCPL